MAEQHHATAGGPPSGDGAEPLQRAARAVAAAQLAADEADEAGRKAGEGIDWVRYHLDGHCLHWRERAGI